MEERAHKAQERYSQRLQEQLNELEFENLPATLSDEDRKEVLTKVIQDALLEVVEACQGVAKNSGLSDGKIVAEIIEKKIGATMKRNSSLPS